MMSPAVISVLVSDGVLTLSAGQNHKHLKLKSQEEILRVKCLERRVSLQTSLKCALVRVLYCVNKCDLCQCVMK